MLIPPPSPGLRHFWALWIEAREMGTNAPAPVGYWTGGRDMTLTIDGQPRVYYAAGGVLRPEPITYETGAHVQVQRVAIGPLQPEVRDMLRGYDTRQARAELHLGYVDAAGAVVGIGQAVSGVVDRFPIDTGEIDDHGNAPVTCQLEIVTEARYLTRTLSLKQSDASQRRRDPADAFHQYSDVSGEVQVVWMGETDNPHRARYVR